VFKILHFDIVVISRWQFRLGITKCMLFDHWLGQVLIVMSI
jgi:hypothetical protein